MNKVYQNNFEEFIEDFSILAFKGFGSSGNKVSINEVDKFKRVIACSIYEDTLDIKYSDKIIKYINKFDYIITTNYDKNLIKYNPIYYHGSFHGKSNKQVEYIKLKKTSYFIMRIT